MDTHSTTFPLIRNPIADAQQPAVCCFCIQSLTIKNIITPVKILVTLPFEMLSYFSELGTGSKLAEEKQNKLFHE